MTKQTFLKRLKKMLTKYPDDACGHCPGAAYFSQEKGPPIGTCQICQNVMGLECVTIKMAWEKKRCPCHRLTPQKAIARAWSVINAWEAEYGSLT